MTTNIDRAVTEIANIALARGASERQIQERSDRDAGSREEWLRYDRNDPEQVNAHVDRHADDKQADYGEMILNALMSPAQLTELPPPVPLVEHFLNLDTIAAIYGRYGTFKSFLALGLACCVAAGLPWYGHAVHKGPVLYVLAEGVAGMARRQTAWLLSEGLTTGDIDAIRWLPNSVDLLDSGWAQGLATAAATLGAVLVVIDTLNRSMPGGDENGTNDMGRIVAAADYIRRKSGAAVLFVHHPPRGGKNLRGSTALEGAVDTALFTEMVAPGTVRLSSGADGVSGKQKDMAPYEDIYFKLEICNGSAVPRLTVAPAGGIRAAVHDERHAAILGELTKCPMSMRQIVSVIPGATLSTIKRDIQGLVASGQVRNCGTAARPVYEPAQSG